MKLKVVLHPDEIAVLPERLTDDSICVVFDILRATTSMVTAFEHGALSIQPVASVEEARQIAANDPELILAGERHGDPPAGFRWGNSPREFTAAAGHRIVMTTTNGTRAIVQSARAGTVWIGAFRNLAALTTELQASADRPIYLICAGTGPELGWEDVMAAGALCERLEATDLNDSTRIAHLAWSRVRDDLAAGLRLADNGRSLLRQGRPEDIDWAAECDRTSVLPRFREGRISLCAEEKASL